MVFPACPLWRSRLRAVQCRATDPVSFALVEGGSVAAFPNVRGWSAEDTARRAVAEHRAWLRSESEPELDMLLTAARAALFLESVEAGSPELPLTLAETARQLSSSVAEESLGRYRELALEDTEPPAGTVAAMRKLVLALPAYP
jgi:hypothetical protein